MMFNAISVLFPRWVKIAVEGDSPEAGLGLSVTTSMIETGGISVKTRVATGGVGVGNAGVLVGRGMRVAVGGTFVPVTATVG